MDASLPAFLPPFTVELDDSEPIVVEDAGRALSMAMAYLEDSPPGAVAVIADAAGNIWAMKTDDAGQVIEVPF